LYDGKAAVDGVELAIAAGEAVGIVGPSGAGKTTLLALLAGSMSPSSGEVAVDGRPLAGLSARELRGVRARMGFVHQDLALVPNLRVFQNVLAGSLGRRSFFSSLRAMLRPARAELEEALALLERVGIGDKLFQRTDRLSGGERQRVAIARALFQEPAALFADEPVSSVDPARARDTLELLTGISRERGLTLVVSLHDPGLAREFLPRLVGLREGRVLFDRRTDELRDEHMDELYRLREAGRGC